MEKYYKTNLININGDFYTSEPLTPYRDVVSYNNFPAAWGNTETAKYFEILCAINGSGSRYSCRKQE